MNGRKWFSVFLCAFMASATSPVSAETIELDMRPVEVAPEPLGELRPELRWMTDRKVRAIWIGDELFGEFGGTD